MDKKELYNVMNNNPVFYLATVDDGQPRVRGMLLYKANDAGIVFHTGSMRDVYKQIAKNPKVELCFNDFAQQMQVRVSGELEVVNDIELKDEISQHPSRTFLKPWKDSIEIESFYDSFIVFKLKNGIATTWTMARNLEPKEIIQL